MEETIVITISFALVMAVPFWIGYRLGHQRGLAAWQRSYRYMTPSDIVQHKKIINAMSQSLDHQ